MTRQELYREYAKGIVGIVQEWPENHSGRLPTKDQVLTELTKYWLYADEEETEPKSITIDGHTVSMTCIRNFDWNTAVHAANKLLKDGLLLPVVRGFGNKMFTYLQPAPDIPKKVAKAKGRMTNAGDHPVELQVIAWEMPQPPKERTKKER